MECTSCGLDREPIIEGDQHGRFCYTCGNPACHSNLGPVKRGGAVAAPAAAQVLAAASPTSILVPQGGSYVEAIRAKLALLDVELAKADVLREERDALRRMLRAAERPSKSKRNAKSNVVPIAKARES